MYPIMTSCVRRGTTNLGPVVRLDHVHAATNTLARTARFEFFLNKKIT